MCGRACCKKDITHVKYIRIRDCNLYSSLDPDSLCYACSYKDTNGKQCIPIWTNTALKYKPSYNMGPQDVLPCMVSGSHFEKQDRRVLCAMIWGMIPPWHQGDYKKRSDKFSTHNGRLEGIQTSKLYSQSLQKRQRCIVVCEGFYEWKAGVNNKLPKQPYYIYAAQNEGMRADNPIIWSDEVSETDGWKGFKVLKLAGIYGTYKTEEGNIIHSCTIITRESDKNLSWLHHRMPVCFNNEEECQAWLNEDLSTDAAVKILNNMTLQEGALKWHPVSTTVNNVHHKTADCRKEMKLKEEKKNSQTSFMALWLQKGSASSNKRKNTINKDTNIDEKEDEMKTLKIRKEN